MTTKSEISIWVFTGRTESGDDVGPYLFDFEPTTEELQELLMDELPGEFEGEPDDWVDPDFGYVSVWSLDPIIPITRETLKEEE